ncbi:hypothetical protein NW755_007694 [Fusarium falciforme]|uniref:Methyltransferase n=1 Tax=Fusarium falciforme TaxID=195108 RepID=A0A9W8R6J3_9HYPO|nr:hypothetical protein NW755_007694 [Fusarium falciforme]
MADETEPSAHRPGSKSPTEPGSSPPGNEAPLEAGDNPADDGDSAFGSEPASSTTSITSSILEYRTVHGRRYHSDRGDAAYWAPNDEQQNESMDINHHQLTLVLGGKLYLSPLKQDIQRVLDIGTGTGIWAIDFADEFPNAEVTGTDISVIQPQWVPPNLKFEIEDCTQTWTFDENSIDYVHMRYLIGSIKDWPALMKEAFRVCKPGGYVESYEGSPDMESDDDTVPKDSAMADWGPIFKEAGAKISRPFTILHEDLARKAMEEAGFVDIESRDFKAPVGAWPKDKTMREIGQFAQVALEQDIEGYVLGVAGLARGWSKDEVAVYCAKLRQEIRSLKQHAYYRIRVVYGRKPEDIA